MILILPILFLLITVESGGNHMYQSDYNAVDDENERLVVGLHDKVSALKSVSTSGTRPLS